MQYRTGRHREQISLLGYGCMRFTRSGGRIDIDKAEREVMAAIRSGVNYLDTAYVYPGNEAAVGEILRRNGCRDQVLLATKLPQYLIRSRSAIDRCFDEERRRLGTDYIDFYLMHMLADVNAWEKLKACGIEDWIAGKKPPDSFGTSASPSTETQRPFYRCWTPMTGTSVRFSTIIWTRPPRRAAVGWRPLRPEASLSSSWNPSGAGGWPVSFLKRRKSF